jgi:hypothetical protein
MRISDLEARSEGILAHLQRKPNDLKAHKEFQRLQTAIHDLNRGASVSPQRTRIKLSQKTTADQIAAPMPAKNPPASFKGSKYAILPPVPVNINNVPEPQRNPPRHNNPRLTRAAAAMVEVRLPIKMREAVVEHFLSLVPDVRDHIRQWVAADYGSLEEAEVLIEHEAKIGVLNDPAQLREWVGQSEMGNKDQLLALPDDKLMSHAGLRKFVIKAHQPVWVRSISDRILKACGVTSSVEVLRKDIESAFAGYHTKVNNPSNTGVRLPFIADLDSVDAEEVANYLNEWWSLPKSERYDDSPERLSLEDVYAKVGKLCSSRAPKEKRWKGYKVYTGIVSRRREGAVLYDRHQEANGLVLALPVKNGKSKGLQQMDAERYIYMDGESLQSDEQLTGKYPLMMPLILKHDFLRWHDVHIANHDAEAPINKRAIQKSFQFFLLIPEDKNKSPKLFLRPIYQFYTQNTQMERNEDNTPQTRYYVGIDRGINKDAYIAVYDTEKKSVIHTHALEGRKDEWYRMRALIAHAQSKVDQLKNAGKTRSSAFLVAQERLRRLRRKSKGLSNVAVTESIAHFITWCEENLGHGQYCIVMEKLNDLNVRGGNRVKAFAKIREAIYNQMLKRGYADMSTKDRKQTHGMFFVPAHYTSCIALSGVVFNREFMASQNDNALIGRKMGEHFSIYDSDGKAMRVRKSHKGATLGCSLMYDPYLKSLRGKNSEKGFAVDADLIGALNIATRPMFMGKVGKDDFGTSVAKLQAEFNQSRLGFECPLTIHQPVCDENGEITHLQQMVI